MENNTANNPSLRPRPTIEQLRQELEREKRKKKPSFLKIFFFVIIVLIIAAITFFCMLSGFVIYGDSMSPTLREGDMVLAIPKATPRSGDMIAFSHEERILIKRVVAGPGDRIEVLPDGSVQVNGSSLSEPYALLSESGTNDMIYPLDIPDHSWFVLGDNRGSSVDSRSSILGLIDDSQILGKIFIRIWPLNRITVYDPNFAQELISALK